MKKRILSALLLAGALVVAPLGGLFSMVATASSNSWSPYPYIMANGVLPQVSSGKITVQEAVQRITASYERNGWKVADVIAADPTVAAVFRQLDMMLGESTSVTETASSQVEAISNVQISGSRLNAASADSAITLTVAAPAQTVDTEGRTSVQVDISLSGVADSHNLTVPVQITMSVPAGLSADNMHILHYVNGIDQAPVNVPFEASNGKITFSTSSFSLFAFVEGQYKAPETNNDNDDNDDDDDDDDNAAPAPAADQGVKDSVPKTGDSTIPVLPFAAAGVACAAAAVVLNRKEQR